MSPAVELGMPATRLAPRPVVDPAVPWADLSAQEPWLAELVGARFAAHPRHVLATLSLLGGPRVSGARAGTGHGELWLVPGAHGRAADDLRGDPRFTLHSNPGDGSRLDGDVKVVGEVVEPDASHTELLRDVGADGPVLVARLLAVTVVRTVGPGTVPGATRTSVTTWAPRRPAQTRTLRD